MYTVAIDENAWARIGSPANHRNFQRQMSRLEQPFHEEVSTYHIPKAMSFFQNLQGSQQVVSLRPLVNYQNCMTALTALIRFYKATAAGILLVDGQNFWMWAQKDRCTMHTVPVISRENLSILLRTAPEHVEALLAPFIADQMVKKVRRDVDVTDQHGIIKTETLRGYRIDPDVILSISGSLMGAPQTIRERSIPFENQKIRSHA